MSKSNPPPVLPYHHGDLRNALIAEGRRLLEEVGPYDLSLRAVARSVGVSIAAPSRHFDGKDALLAAIAADGFHELAAERRRITASPVDPMLKVYQVMESYVRFALRKPGMFDLMIGPRILQREDYPELQAIASESFELFASAVREYAHTQGWLKKDMGLVVHAAWSVEHGLARLSVAHRAPFPGYKVDLEKMTRFSISMLLSGLAAGPEHLSRVTAELA